MKDCIFCKIVAGKIPAKFAYQSDQVVAFPDINPHAPVHLLIVPRKHFETLGDFGTADRALAGEIILAAGQLTKDHKIAKTGYRLISNNGPDGRQEVGHLHFHLLGGQSLGPMLSR